MEKRAGKLEDGGRVNNIPVQSENIAFGADEMVPCGKCGRTNPPNRTGCFYCAAELNDPRVRAESVTPVLRKLEVWEKGYNVLYHPSGEGPSRAVIAEIAKALSLEPQAAEEIFLAERPVPVARVEGEKEAAIVSEAMEKHGLEASVIGDRALAPDIFPKRLRGIQFSGDEIILTLFNTGEITRVARSDLALVVVGEVFEQRTETIEKRKKGKIKTLDETETSSDEILIDIYTDNDPAGWRIPTRGFDFSCLGPEKGLLAARNMLKLIAKLREFAPGARLADGYAADKERLGHIWEVEQRKDSQGLRRSGFGKTDFGKVASTNNLGQFTKYSRLQWQLL
jgi:hypothetical protein